MRGSSTRVRASTMPSVRRPSRSEEHTSELQSQPNLVCRLLLEKKAPRQARKPHPGDLDHFLQPTTLLPTDGIVKATATQITNGAAKDADKARAVYEWGVHHTVR